MYANGKGVAKNCAKALEIYDHSCNKQNNALACGYIASEFEYGTNCTSMNLSAAAGYSEKACRLGSQPDCKSLEEIKSKMSR